MDVKELTEAKRELEIEIVEAVSLSVERFKEKYKISPTSIYLDTVVEQPFGSRTKEMIVVGCSISIEL